MTDSPVLVERRGAIGYLHLNRPDVLNALDASLIYALLEGAQSLASDSDVHVVVLNGNGRAFMAGGDLAQLRAASREQVDTLIGVLHQTVQLLAEMPKPVLASVHGSTAGAGMSLMMAADLAIAAEDTSFSFAYTDIATNSDGGLSWALPRQVGLRKALEIALLSEQFDAAEALRLGLVNRVVASERLAEATGEMALRLAERAPHVLANLKRLLRSSLQNSLSEQLDAERQGFVDCAGRPEFAAAIDAFYARRKRS